MLGSARLSLAAEPHGSGLQLLRILCRPRCSLWAVGLGIALGGLGCAAAVDGAWIAHVLLDGAALWILFRAIRESGTATAVCLAVVRKIERIDKKDLPRLRHNRKG